MKNGSSNNINHNQNSIETTTKNSLEQVVAQLQNAKLKTGFTNSMIEKLFNSFLDSNVVSMKLMHQAIEKEDIKTIKDAAHAIRGSALFLYFNQISDLSNMLEYDKNANYDKLYKELQKELSLLMSIKTEILSEIKKLA